MDKDFNRDPVYKKKHLKVKINFYNGKFNTNFYNNKTWKEGPYIFVSVILIHSVYRTGNNHYSQAFLGECKCVVKEKRR